MMDEERTRYAVLMEDVQRDLRVLAESSRAQTTRMDEMEQRFDRGIQGLDVKLVGVTVEMREIKTKVDNLQTLATDAAPRLERLEAKVDNLEALTTDAAPRLERLETKVDNLEALTTDAAPRLERIEAHLALNAPLPRREAKRPPSKHHRRKPAKRT